jgi:5-amino-6-(5-phospho-D-ribitylamino)uracil phosphatase
VKTVYYSDLDGTLLNHDAELSEYTVKTLNDLVGRGLLFGVATARTAATVSKILARVPVNMPAVLMNGVCIYDLAEERYLKTEAIPAEARAQMLKIIGEHKLRGFIYAMKDNKMATFYENADSPYTWAFMEERIRKYGKIFTQVENFSALGQENLIYYSVSDTKELLMDACQKLSVIPGLHVEFYHDIYGDQNWYLEACSGRASKQNAINFLRRSCGFDWAVGFGDNLNDLSLFAACDECYAVGNAKAEVLMKADAIIGTNVEDGVARWLETHAVLPPGR